MTVSDMEIYEPQRQYLGSLGLLSCSVIYYEQLCDSFIVAEEKAILQVRTKLLKSTETSKKILTLAKDLRVEIS